MICACNTTIGTITTCKPCRRIVRRPVAGSLPNVFYFYGSNFPAIGPNFNSPQARNTRRYELVESLSWQIGNHRLKFGGDLNPTYSAGLWGFCTPMCVGAVSPTFINSILPPSLVG